MPYAIMQKELITPELDRLVKAFRVLPTLTALDAQTTANDAFGVLLKGLDLEPAGALQDALMKQGVEVEVVEESDLPIVPPAKLVRQMEFHPEHLTMYDPMGRAFNLRWSDLMLIAAGDVRLPEFKHSQAKPETLSSHHHWAETPVEGWQKDPTQFHLMLELILQGGIGRYSVTADDFIFNHLGSRLTSSLATNFSLLVKDLAQFAPHAGLNRGANLICENSEDLFAYPSKAAFYEEMVWILWRTARAAAGA